MNEIAKKAILGGSAAIASLIGGIAASSQLRKGEKRVKATDEQSLSAIAKEKAIKPTDRIQNMAFIKEGDENARKQKAIAKRGFAGGAISIPRAVGNNYVDAVKKIAASTSARRKYLQDMEDNVSRAKTQRDNYFSDAKAKAWATAANESIKAAQNYKPAGGVASKDATKVEVDTPTTETYNLGDLWQNGKQTGNMEALASQLNNKRANMPTELLSMPYYNKG